MPVPQQLTQSLAENLLTLLCLDPINGRLIAGLVTAELFSNELHQLVARRVLDYWRHHNQPPGKIHTPDVLADILEDRRHPQNRAIRDLLSSMMLLLDSNLNTTYVLDQLQAFVRMQEFNRAVMETAQQLTSRQQLANDDIEQMWGKLLRTRHVTFEPGTRLGDYNKLLEWMERRTKEFTTGIKTLDDAGIIPARGNVMLYLAPKGSGKCIVEGEPVCLGDGGYVSIEAFPEQGEVWSYAVGDWIRKSARLAYNGLKRAYRITLRSGRELDLTKEHRLRTRAGWSSLSTLGVGDKIASPLRLPFGSERCDLRIVRVLGYLIADGGLTNGVTFYKDDAIIVRDMQDALTYFGLGLTPIINRKSGGYYVTGSGKGRPSPLIALLKEVGLLGKKSNVKTVPSFVFKLNKLGIANFLQCLFSCDGSVYKTTSGGWQFEYSTTSRMLARQVDHLLTRFGIVAKIRRRKQQVSGRDYFSWSLVITRRLQLGVLENEIGLLSYKGDLLEESMVQTYNPVMAKTSSTIIADCDGDFFYDEIISIKGIGYKHTYDLAVVDTHNFVAGNILVHNSWFLTNVAKRGFRENKKVSLISTEMYEPLVLQRLYQSLFAVPKNSKIKLARMARLELDRRERFAGIVEEEIELEWALDSSIAADELASHLLPFGLKVENLIIKYFPRGTLTMDRLRAYLDNLELVENFIPDMVVLDYFGLIKTDPKNKTESLTSSFHDFCSILAERNIAGVTAHQLTRKGAAAMVAGSTQVAGSWEMVGAADDVLVYSASEAERVRGLGRLMVNHSRENEDHWTSLLCQNYSIGQYCLESIRLPPEYQEYLSRLGDQRREPEEEEENGNVD
jgi:intein/homing endonuclease